MKTIEERTESINRRKRPCEQRPSDEMWVADRFRTFPVYEVPTDDLVLNVENRRFRAERMWAEHELGRPLDPENNPTDERSIESLLLDRQLRIEDGDRIVGTESPAYEALRNDWRRRGQERPIWIRPDGTVRNGNRRLAMIKREQREHGDVGLQWVQAILLEPDDVDEQMLLEMEQHEQLTENFKVRYNDIDYLLALREMAESRNIDWFSRASIEEVGGQLQALVEKTANEVIRDLYAIKYMDRFLEDSEQTGEYHTLLRTLELFRDIGRTMIRVETDYELDSDAVLQVLFAAIRSGKKYQDVRVLRRMFFRSRDRFMDLAERIEQHEGDWEPGADSRIDTPETADLFQEEDDESTTGDGSPEVSGYPRQQVGQVIDVAMDAFGAEENPDIDALLFEIANRLEALSSHPDLERAFEGGDEDTDTRRAMVRRIFDWSDHMRGRVLNE